MCISAPQYSPCPIRVGWRYRFTVRSMDEKPYICPIRWIKYHNVTNYVTLLLLSTDSTQWFSIVCCCSHCVFPFRTLSALILFGLCNLRVLYYEYTWKIRFDTRWKEFFKKIHFEKNQQRTKKKHTKFPRLDLTVYKVPIHYLIGYNDHTIHLNFNSAWPRLKSRIILI